ncbi:MAG: hypothetical protein D6728_16465 [Cyanobacteria bacterium J055]|nr:MAG: hypothetical protein D6728_16465 [Cyanobacteria bacterium J055]
MGNSKSCWESLCQGVIAIDSERSIERLSGRKREGDRVVNAFSLTDVRTIARSGEFFIEKIK